MARRRRPPNGKCFLCGRDGKLSFEHVPPASAFNDTAVVDVDAVKALDDPFFKQGPTHQRGIGHYRLCKACNSNTGAWYGSALVSFCFQAVEYLRPSQALPVLALPYYLYPLRVLKQIVTMFFVVNEPGFRDKAPELASFVLNKTTTGLPRPFRVFVYATVSNTARQVGWAIRARREEACLTFTEIALRPLGYVMPLGVRPPTATCARSPISRARGTTTFTDDSCGCQFSSRSQGFPATTGRRQRPPRPRSVFKQSPALTPSS